LFWSYNLILWIKKKWSFPRWKLSTVLSVQIFCQCSHFELHQKRKSLQSCSDFLDKFAFWWTSKCKHCREKSERTEMLRVSTSAKCNQRRQPGLEYTCKYHLRRMAHTFGDSENQEALECQKPSQSIHSVCEKSPFFLKFDLPAENGRDNERLSILCWKSTRR